MNNPYSNIWISKTFGLETCWNDWTKITPNKLWNILPRLWYGDTCRL